MTDKDKQHPAEILRARELRVDRPKAEALLWSKLRGAKAGFKFRRQHPVGTYIVDFACVAKRLVIEVDGISHESRQAEDEQRDETLQLNGWRVVRYTNEEILRNMDDVVADIIRNLTLDPLT